MFPRSFFEVIATGMAARASPLVICSYSCAAARSSKLTSSRLETIGLGGEALSLNDFPGSSFGPRPLEFGCSTDTDRRRRRSPSQTSS